MTKKSCCGLDLCCSPRVVPLPFTLVNVTSTPQHRALRQVIVGTCMGLAWLLRDLGLWACWPFHLNSCLHHNIMFSLHRQWCPHLITLMTLSRSLFPQRHTYTHPFTQYIHTSYAVNLQAATSVKENQLTVEERKETPQNWNWWWYITTVQAIVLIITSVKRWKWKVKFLYIPF